MRRLALLLLLLLGAARHAGAIGEAFPVYLGGTYQNSCSGIDFLNTGFQFVMVNGRCQISLNSSVVYGSGSCVGGASGDFLCATVDMTNKQMIVPVNTTTPATSGQARMNSTSKRFEWYDGTRIHGVSGETPYGIGGDGSDGVFAMAPTSSGSCSAGDCDDICSSCTGTRPACTCVLPVNSFLMHANATDAQTTQYSCVYNFTTFSLSGGTVVCGQAGAYANGQSSPVSGVMLWIRVQTSISITGGTIDQIGKGGYSGAGGNSGTAGNRAGGNGCGNGFFPGSGGGAAGNNAGSTPTAPASNPRLFFNRLPWGPGAGGGGGAGSNTAGGTCTLNLGAFSAEQWFAYGGLGGGGGGCSSSAGSAAGQAGGRGGGGLIFEFPGPWVCTGATFDTSGAAGTASGNAGSGGGGAGSLDIVTLSFTGTDTCTYNANGGAAGTKTDSNCALGAAGTAGPIRKISPPF